MPVVFRDGQRLAYRAEGEGPPLLLAHNLFCDGSIFDGVVARLRGRCRALAVDLRGHGGSLPARAPFTTRDLALDLAAVLEAEGGGPAVLAGVSLGACAAMELALARPHLAGALVLMGATGRRATAGDRVVHALMAAVLGAAGLPRRAVPRVLGGLFGEPFRAERPAEHAAWAERVAALDPRGARLAVRAWTRRPLLLGRLGALTVPVLVLAGELDRACPPSHAEELRAAVPGARLERLPGTGHTAPVERPAEVAARIAPLLAAASRSSASP